MIEELRALLVIDCKLVPMVVPFLVEEQCSVLALTLSKTSINSSYFIRSFFLGILSRVAEKLVVTTKKNISSCLLDVALALNFFKSYAIESWYLLG